MVFKSVFKTILLITISSASIMNAQEFTKAGSSAAQFLKIPVGAKAVSMGSAFTSIANDVSALYWNSAGIAKLDRISMNFTNTQWIADMNHNYFGMVLPLDGVSSVGIGVIQFSTGQIENTTILQPKGTGIFYDAEDLAVSVSYARQLIEQVSVGVSAKYVSQRIWNTTAQTVAFDLGILLNTGFHDLKMGFSFQNFGPELTMKGSDLVKTVDLDPSSETNPLVESNLTTQPFSLPTSYRAGISMAIIGNTGMAQISSSTLIVSAEALHLNDNPEHYSVGLEYGFMDVFFLRGGYIFNTDEEGLTLGSGLSFNLGSSVITFDYAYADFGVFDGINVFSLYINP